MGFLHPQPFMNLLTLFQVTRKLELALTHVKRWLSFIKQHLNSCDRAFSTVPNCGSSTSFHSCLRFTVSFGFQNATYPKLSDFSSLFLDLSYFLFVRVMTCLGTVKNMNT